MRTLSLFYQEAGSRHHQPETKRGLRVVHFVGMAKLPLLFWLYVCSAGLDGVLAPALTRDPHVRALSLCVVSTVYIKLLCGLLMHCQRRVTDCGGLDAEMQAIGSAHASIV